MLKYYLYTMIINEIFNRLYSILPLYSYLYNAQYSSMIYLHTFIWLALLKCHLGK